MCIRFTRALADAVLALLRGATFVEADSARGLVALEEVANARIATIFFWVAAAEIECECELARGKRGGEHVLQRRCPAQAQLSVLGCGDLETNGWQVRRPDMIGGRRGW